MPEFPTKTPISILASFASGSINITTEDRQTVNVVVSPCGDSERSRLAAEAIDVEFSGDSLTIEAPVNTSWHKEDRLVKVEVQAPSGSSALINVASASVNCRGQYSQVQVNSASSEMEIDEVSGDVTINTASGDTRIISVGGRLTTNTASGDVLVANVDGSVQVNTASGDIKIAESGGDVHSKSASGDLQIGAAHSGTISANSTSGDVSVGVVPDTGVWLDLNSKSGSISSELDTSGDPPDTHELSIQVRTVSGDIDILRAKQRAAI